MAERWYLKGGREPGGGVVGAEIAEIGEESFGRADVRGSDEQIPLGVGLLHFVASAHFREGKTPDDEDHEARDAAVRAMRIVPLTITHGSRRRRVVA